MSEPTPSSLIADAADGAAQALNEGTLHESTRNERDTERLLADFRAWLHEAPAALTEDAGLPEPELDLSALLAPFVALRHEVNLQTKASRAQLEQNAQALEQLRLALEVLRRPPPSAPSAEE